MSNGHGGSRIGAGRPRKSGKFAYPELNITQIKELLDSPHIHSVSKKTISFTKAFKELFWQRYCDGVEPAQIFTDADLSISTLSRDRIYSFTKALKLQVEKGQDFTEGREPKEQSKKLFDFPALPRRANSARIPNLSEAEVAKLINQVAYMSQEIAFLKKIILLDKEKK